MSEAPQNGELIEILINDGKPLWVEASWSDSAYDGSPYGTPGWAQSDGGYLLLDGIAWRYPSSRPSAVTNPSIYGSSSDSPLVNHSLKQPIIVCGLGFGDESKGATVDYLASSIPDAVAVVRWSGGANAAHNVRHGPRHHTFRQFGAGTFLGLPTLLAREFIFNPQALLAEAVELESKGVHNPLDLVHVHPDCSVVTPILIALNRARELLRGFDRHGSCGLGIGETVVHRLAETKHIGYLESVGNFEIPGPISDDTSGVILARDINGLGELSNFEMRRKLIRALEYQELYAAPLLKKALAIAPEFAQDLSYGELGEIADELISAGKNLKIHKDFRLFNGKLTSYLEEGTVIFEGSQGILLDEKWGFHPHTTWSATEPSHLVDYLYSLGYEHPYILGVTRSFMTRHGDGPMPSESRVFSATHNLPEDDNGWGRYQGDFRVGPLDLPLLSFSNEVLSGANIPIDGIAVSHLDAFKDDLYPAVVSYDYIENPASHWTFSLSGESDYERVDSDELMEVDFIGALHAEIKNFSESELLREIERRMQAPVAIVARGAYRKDRSFAESSFLDEKILAENVEKQSKKASSEEYPDYFSNISIEPDNDYLDAVYN